MNYAKRWWVLVAIGMGIFLGTIDGSIVNIALPTLEDDLTTSFATVQWVVISYLLCLATLVLAVGRLGDMVGKKSIYTAGFGVFTAGSMLCGIAPGVGWLIAFRVVQGVGAAMIFALGFAIVTESFPPAERGRALGLTGSIVSLGIIIGPTLGGLIIESLSWRWIFFVNLPVGIIGTLTAMRFIPDVAPRGSQHFDFLGAGVFCAALLALLLSLTAGQGLGFGHPAVLALGITGALCIGAFVTIERRVAEPMLDLGIFRNNRLLVVNLVTGWMSFTAVSGLVLLLPFYLEGVLGHGPRTVGLLLASLPAALGIVAPFSGSLSDRIGPRPVTVAGLAILVIGYLGAEVLAVDTTPLVFVLAMIPIGIGLGTFQSPNNSAVMGSVPPERLGVTSSMLTITRITGQLTGIATLGALWAARVGAITGARGDPAGAPAAAQVGALHDTTVVTAGLMMAALAVAGAGWIVERRRVTRPAPS